MNIPKSEKLQPKDYGEESVNGSGIQPEQVEDIMDFVEPEEYLKSEEMNIQEWSMGLYFSDDNTLGENIDHNDFTSIWENGYIKGKHINNKESLAELRFRASEIKGRDDQIIKWQKMHAEEKRRTYQAQQEIDGLGKDKVILADRIAELQEKTTRTDYQLSEKEKQILSMRNHDNCHNYPYDYRKEVCAKCGSIRYMDNWKQKK